MASVVEDIVGGRGFGFGGDGMGGGNILTGLILGALLGRGGLGGIGGGDRGCAEPISTAAILSQLADIKAAVPFNEAQLQLALAQASAQLTAQGTANTMSLANQLNTVALQTATNFALVARDIAAVDTNVDRQSATIQTAIHADGEATRALITTNLIAQLNAEKVILANELAEERNERSRERDRHGVEITMTQNNNQQQLQFQAQSQAINQLANLIAGLNNQFARATNSSVVVGSTGVGTLQTATPTNVNA